jgi:hypothetical protein
MSFFWSILAKPKNRQTLAWIGGGVAVLASGAWAVVTYVWPADKDTKIVCAQQGSISAARDASGNTINYNGSSAAGVNGGTVCVTIAK